MKFFKIKKKSYFYHVRPDNIFRQKMNTLPVLARRTETAVINGKFTRAENYYAMMNPREEGGDGMGFVVDLGSD
jgi:hypothetical protein